MMKYTIRKIIFSILRFESKMVLAKYKPKIIAITGSVGKTSTKDAIYATLSKSVYVRKSKKSYNSEIGLPLTVLGLPNGWSNLSVWLMNALKGLWLVLAPHKYPKWLVLEVGVGKPGDMKKTASWLKTDVVVITAIGETPAHIEFFSSREHLIEEKSGLIKTLKPDGLLILNKDDESVMGMKKVSKNRFMTFGFNPESYVKGEGVNVLYDESEVPKGIIFRVDAMGSNLPVSILGVFGQNHIYAALAAFAVSAGLKFNMLSAVEAVKNYDVPPGRMRLITGINGSLIIDDTYNSSPFACEKAIRTLGEVKSMRKIAILGDMLELGKHTIEAHEDIGKIVCEKVDILIVVGPRAESIRDGAIAFGMQKKNIFEFTNSTLAGEYAASLLREGDVVLVKGSQGVRMERVVAQIMQDKKDKEKLLVRQEPEWLAKD